MRILGVDPGSLICGYGVIEKNHSKLELIEFGVISMNKKHEDLNLRTREIFLRISQVIERTKPDIAAFESAFYSKNVQSLLKLTQAKAVAILPATLAEIPIFEYSPREVKKSVTGNGNASKEQVEYMVKKILNMVEENEFMDATDALAVAICHSNRIIESSGNPKVKNWKDFIKSNPDRVVKL
jgi:crossover junction endodeoxyribonuclease RuvC